MNTNSILNRKNGKRPKGFTLIELLVVVIIIGILAAIAVPIFLNQRRAAWKASAESDASNATLAIETARTQGGTLDGVQFGGGNGGAPMTITVGSETTKATVSPGNTEEAWVSKDASGDECYAVMTTNANIPSWAAVRTSSGSMTTGTPPANGSADCPRPVATPNTLCPAAANAFCALYLRLDNVWGEVSFNDVSAKGGVYAEARTAPLLLEVRGAWPVVSVNGTPVTEENTGSAAAPVWELSGTPSIPSSTTTEIRFKNGQVLTLRAPSQDPGPSDSWDVSITPAA